MKTYHHSRPDVEFEIDLADDQIQKLIDNGSITTDNGTALLYDGFVLDIPNHTVKYRPFNGRTKIVEPKELTLYNDTDIIDIDKHAFSINNTGQLFYNDALVTHFDTIRILSSDYNYVIKLLAKTYGIIPKQTETQSSVTDKEPLITLEFSTPTGTITSTHTDSEMPFISKFLYLYDSKINRGIFGGGILTKVNGNPVNMHEFVNKYGIEVLES